MFQHKDRGDFNQPVEPEFTNSDVRPVDPSSKPSASNLQHSLENRFSVTSTSFIDGYHASVVTVPREITQPTNSRAIDYFLSTHVFRECGIPRGYYEYLTVFIAGIGNSQQLVTSLSAVALAAYANTFQHPDLLQEARRQYGYALRLVNTALSSPEETTKSSTLSAVLLLNTFHTLTGDTKDSFVPCVSHMIAAQSILGINGHGLVQSSTCLQLLLHVCWSLLQTYITCSTRIPEQVINLREVAASALDTNDPGWKLSDLIINVAKFRADVKEGILLGRESIVQIALDLDLDVSSLADSMPIGWLFEPIPVKELSDLVFGTCYHVYPDQWVAHVWNNIRTSRLLLHKEIRTQLMNKLALSPLSFSESDALQYQNSTKILHQMISEICATVPQCSGYLHVLAAGGQTLAAAPGFSEQTYSLTNGIPTIAGAYLILWPLLNAGQSTESDEQRNWIVKRTRYIGRLTGIRQAFVFADIIDKREEIKQYF